MIKHLISINKALNSVPKKKRKEKRNEGKKQNWEELISSLTFVLLKDF